MAEKTAHTATWRVECSVYEHMAAEIVGDRGIAQVWAGPNAMEHARLIAAAPALLSIAERWAALDGGAWNVDRHAAEKAELLADTRSLISRAKDA